MPVHPVYSPLVVFAVVLAATVLVVPAVRRMAQSGGLFEAPVEDRWHRRPVPKLGGVAIAAVFLPVAWYLTTFGFHDHQAHLRALVTTAGALFLVGVVDDVWPMRAITKLAWQTAAASLFVWTTGAASVTGIAWIDVALSVTWYVGITNAFNLLDNIDGLAAGIAGIAATFMAVALVLPGDGSLVALALVTSALAGGAFGFLVHNWHPASIFMGDAGSHLLGSVLAGATLLAATHLGNGTSPGAAMAIVLLLVPCADTLLVTLTRQLAGRSAFVGGRDHLSHRIVALGMPDSKAVLALYALAAAGGGAAIGLQTLSAPVGWMLVAAYGTLVAAGGVYLAHVETAAGGAAPLPGEVATRYRTYELLFDAILIAVAYYLALVLRFRDPDQLQAFLGSFSSILPLVLGLHLSALWLVGCYRRPLSGTGSADVLTIAKGAALGSAASVIAVLYLTRFEGYSRQAFAVAAVLVVLLLAGGHASLNALDEYLRRRKPAGPRALIYGAGPRGALAARELSSNPALGLAPLGFIDDDSARLGDRPEGLRVLGTIADLDALLDANRTVTTIVVSSDDCPPARFAQLCTIAARHDVTVRQLRLRLDEIDTGGARRARGIVRFR
ncbi:MAG: hypothetical protein IT184_08215 [Acidobacteria bacterium]|nr:hypothetical protein [Acidobacteriota bacterium]